MSRGTLFALVAAFMLASALAACKGRPHDPANLTAIDSMLVQVDSLTRVVNAIDAPVYDRMDSVFRTQKDRLEAYMTDTLDRDRAMAVGNYYRAMAKSLPRVRRQRGEVLDELGTSRRQLTDLRHDVAGGLLPPGPERTYVQQERLALDAIAQRLGILLNSQGTAQRNWDAHHVLVDSLLRSAAPKTAP